MIIMTAEFFIGITVNGFLIIVNCYDLVKSRKILLLQILLICTGLSRFGLQMMLMTQSFFSVFFPFAYETNIYGPKMMFLWMFFSSVGLWFATCLSVFYCLKVSNFTQHWFLWLKFRISKCIFWLLLGSLLASVGTATVCIKVGLPLIEDSYVLRNPAVNVSKVNLLKNDELLLVNLTLVLPLSVFVMCTSMLCISLYKHKYQVQNRLHEFSNARTEAHMNALKMVTTFFCFFISYFAAFMANMTFRIPYRSHRFFVVKEVMAAYPAGHSIIIILSNSKLKDSFRTMICLMKKQ
uniref:Taste receptor type 2 n=1 Tax=Nannospalax galili TaxID=1026970 RepID=A0A0N9NAB3_NANGA|nr:taste receptor type 2 member 18 [Nannospalax galili]ALG92824.1 taste receptor type 2 member 18 [Nannospalax galili]ALG92830.1 taste receptor type 2 member 18 [Nannospalax galili]ALG92832.1 taste receptor type 2 member 18 [Nannospalax galili]ALG92834.1 taste receptor type 2 member 18 [Nannospalax galili]